MLATEFLADLVRRLESREVTYALVGSIATMSYGEPRATLDIDVVVALGVSGLDTVTRLFPPPTAARAVAPNPRPFRRRRFPLE